ncbi:hypothetical protein QJS66_02115 [Kocuria rhizophila]|nr:hypothetical protein QJS66_02115 [Kocuria rhizophila]
MDLARNDLLRVRPSRRRDVSELMEISASATSCTLLFRVVARREDVTAYDVLAATYQQGASQTPAPGRCGYRRTSPWPPPHLRRRGGLRDFRRNMDMAIAIRTALLLRARLTAGVWWRSSPSPRPRSGSTRPPPPLRASSPSPCGRAALSARTAPPERALPRRAAVEHAAVRAARCRRGQAWIHAAVTTSLRAGSAGGVAAGPRRRRAALGLRGHRGRGGLRLGGRPADGRGRRRGPRRSGAVAAVLAVTATRGRRPHPPSAPTGVIAAAARVRHDRVAVGRRGGGSPAGLCGSGLVSWPAGSLRAVHATTARRSRVRVRRTPRRRAA